MSDEIVTKERSCEYKTVVASLDPSNKYAVYVNPSLGKKERNCPGSKIFTLLIESPISMGQMCYSGRFRIDTFIS